MFKFVQAFIVVYVFGTLVKGQECHIKGYYWKEFKGTIPDDALEGGTDADGDPIYIGQVYNKYVIPAKIYKNDRKAYYEYGGSEYKTTDKILILCTLQPERFEWIKTNNDDIGKIKNVELLIGGYEPGTTTYIGRVQSGKEVAVGKALIHTFFIFSGLHVTKNGSGHRHTSFEVLAFNTSLPEADIR